MRVGGAERVVYLDGLAFELNTDEDPMFVCGRSSPRPYYSRNSRCRQTPREFDQKMQGVAVCPGGNFLYTHLEKHVDDTAG